MQGRAKLRTPDWVPHPTGSEPAAVATPRAAVIGIAGPLIFTVTVILGGAITPGYNHVYNTISELIGWEAPWRPPLEVGIAAGYILLATWGLLLPRLLPRGGPAAVVAAVAIVVTAALGLLLMFYPFDMAEPVKLLFHHVYVVIMVGGSIVAIVAFAVAIHRARNGRPGDGIVFIAYSAATAVVVIAAGLTAGLAVLNAEPNTGLWQKLCVGAFLLWQVAASAMIGRRLAATTPGDGRILPGDRHMLRAGAAAAAVAAAVLIAGAIAAGSFATPGHDTETVSMLTSIGAPWRGSIEFAFTVGYLLLALFALLLPRLFPEGGAWSFRAAFGLGVAVAAGLAVLLVPSDPDSMSIADRNLHRIISAVLAVGALGAMACFALGARPTRPGLAAYSWASVAGVVIFAVPTGTAIFFGWPDEAGAWQKIAMAAFLQWLAVVAIALARRIRAEDAAPALGAGKHVA